MSAEGFLQTSATGVRTVSQGRSSRRQHQLAEAAVSVMASEGIDALTHRRVASAAGLSLAATTYYFQTREDLVHEASRRLLSGHMQSVTRQAKRLKSEGRLSPSVLSSLVLERAAGRNRGASLAWCEIMLAAGRDGALSPLARDWVEGLLPIWNEAFEAIGETANEDSLRSAVDTLIGLCFMVLALGISPARLRAMLEKGLDAQEVSITAPSGSVPQGLSAKAQATRERILVSAIEILMADGSRNLTFRAVAKNAGLTPAAPSYYFATIADLLAAAQERIFERSKGRYRQVVAGVMQSGLDIDGLADLAAAVFQREVTEYGAAALASYPIWIEAARKPELRPGIWAAINDQLRAWSRLLGRIDPHFHALEALVIQALFVGKLIRLLATGGKPLELGRARAEFIGALENHARAFRAPALDPVFKSGSGA